MTDEMIEEFRMMFVEMENKRVHVESDEYENWLYDYILKHKAFDDFEDTYLYGKPDGVSDEDVENIYLISYYWDYMRNQYGKPEPKCCQEFGTVEGEYKFVFPLKGLKCRFVRYAGCGCYVHMMNLVETKK